MVRAVGRGFESHHANNNASHARLDLIKIGKQYFEIEYDNIIEYKLKKKTVLVFEKIILDRREN